MSVSPERRKEIAQLLVKLSDMLDQQSEKYEALRKRLPAHERGSITDMMMLDSIETYALGGVLCHAIMPLYLDENVEDPTKLDDLGRAVVALEEKVKNLPAQMAQQLDSARGFLK